VDRKVFECLRCGHFTPFAASTRPSCGMCGCMTGIVDNDSESPRFRDMSEAVPARLRRVSGKLEH
jgi:hypothetical protein